MALDDNGKGNLLQTNCLVVHLPAEKGGQRHGRAFSIASSMGVWAGMWLEHDWKIGEK